MVEVQVQPVVNPFVQEKLNPEHLSMLFPATFYQNDESLALHLTESCLVETTTWEDDNAIGETAFWLKVLSTPQSDYLKQQKRLFKQAIAEKCKNLSLSVTVLPAQTTLPTVKQLEAAEPPKKKQRPEKPPSTPAPNKPTTLITVNENVPITAVAEFEDGTTTDPTWKEMQKQATEKEKQIGQETLDAIASPTPGFGLKSFKCKLCAFATDTRERLNHHQKHSHADERPYACEYCDYTSRYPWNIKTHIENVHLKTKKFQCDQCTFASPQACLLRRHINRVHNNQKNLKCDMCDYRANHKDVLRRHIHMKHTKEFDHKCPYCDFGRDAKYEVEDHINAVHLKKVIYQCSDCSFQTYRKITLRSHHKDHETKTVMKCPSCDMKSIYPSVLARHIKAEHPDVEMPEDLKDIRKRGEPKSLTADDADYTPVLMCKCKLCDFTSETISKLKSHVRKTHKSNHICTKCNMRFANKRNLKKHNERKHGIFTTEDDDGGTVAGAPADAKDEEQVPVVAAEAVEHETSQNDQDLSNLPVVVMITQEDDAVENN